jgi:hypothetical protein
MLYNFYYTSQIGDLGIRRKTNNSIWENCEASLENANIIIRNENIRSLQYWVRM